MNHGPLYLQWAEHAHHMGWERETWLCLLWWAECLPIRDCDDLGLCNGPSDRHDCVDCVKKRLTRYPLV